MGKGGNVIGGLLEGHPTQAITGSDSAVAKLLDGQPYSALHGGGGHKGASGAATAPTIPHTAAAVPSANNFAPAGVNMNNIAQGTQNPLAIKAGSPSSANPLTSATATGAPANPTSIAQNFGGMAMQQIQHPEFQNFVTDIMKNIGTTPQAPSIPSAPTQPTQQP